uniref:Uncharacterized protein n=1 Tax=Rhizophora mucronata TaxID=61149 RepID=A0A2P2QS34_RHIMU
MRYNSKSCYELLTGNILFQTPSTTKFNKIFASLLKNPPNIPAFPKENEGQHATITSATIHRSNTVMFIYIYVK